jgi:hypothetical protein
MSLTQRVVLCEGYSDRAFRKGWQAGSGRIAQAMAV